MSTKCGSISASLCMLCCLLLLLCLVSPPSFKLCTLWQPWHNSSYISRNSLRGRPERCFRACACLRVFVRYPEHDQDDFNPHFHRFFSRFFFTRPVHLYRNPNSNEPYTRGGIPRITGSHPVTYRVTYHMCHMCMYEETLVFPLFD